MMKAAFVELVPVGAGAAPNVVIFQFNPETLRRTMSPAAASLSQSGVHGSHPLAVTGAPSESLSFSLSMDATHRLTDSDLTAADDAAKYGLYTRLSALEMLVFPSTVNDLVSSGGGKRSTPTALLPMLLFVWGPSRILPVRITSLSITEKLYDAQNLNPTHAEAQVELRVITPDDLRGIKGRPSETAQMIYRNTQRLRVAGALRALTNLGAAARDDLIGVVQQAVTSGAGNVLPG